MKFITTKKETTFTALSHKFLGVHSAKTSAASKHAVATLHAANPHLHNKKKLPAKTLVLLPDAPDSREKESQSTAVVSEEILAQLKQTLAAAETVLKNSFASETSEFKTSLALSKDRNLLSLVKQSPQLRTSLVQIVDQTQSELEQIDSLKTAQLAGLEQLEKDLAALSA